MLKIHDWEKFQQYTDGRPLHWIKVWHKVLDSHKFSKLSDSEFGALVKIWLLAAKNENKVENDPDWIKQTCGLSKLPNITKYIALGFLEDDMSVPSGTVHVYESVPRKEENRKEEEENIYSRANKVLDYLNEKKQSKYSDTTQIIARLKEGKTVDECKQVIDNKFKDQFFLNEPKYLSPQTLFKKSHFDKYLNDTPHPLEGVVSDITKKNIDTGQRWLNEE